MSILDEIRSSVKNPASIKSFYVLFVTVFFLLLIPLTVFGVLSERTLITQAQGSCALPAEKTFTGRVTPNQNGDHAFIFKGTDCSLNAWVNGDGNSDLALWIYQPDGTIRVVDDRKDKSYEFVSIPAPVKEGGYRLSVRLKSGVATSYTTTVSFR